MPMVIKVGTLSYNASIDNSEIDNGTCGSTYHQTGQIRISPYMASGEYKTTLLHEVMHACAHFAGIVDKEELDEETWIGRLSPIILLVLQENPHLVHELIHS